MMLRRYNIMNRWKVRTQLNLVFAVVILFVFSSIMVMLHIVLRDSYRNNEQRILESYGKQIADNIDNRIDYYVSYIKLVAGDRQLTRMLEQESFPVAGAQLQATTQEFRVLNRGRVESVRLYLSGNYAPRDDYINVDNIMKQFAVGGSAYQSNCFVTCAYLNSRNEKVFSIFSKLYQTNLSREYYIELRVYESDLYTLFSVGAHDNSFSVLIGDTLLSTNNRLAFGKMLHEQKRNKTFGVLYEKLMYDYSGLPSHIYSTSIALRNQNNIKVVIDTSIDNLDRGYWTMFMRLVPVILIIMAIAVFFVERISTRIQRRFKQLQARLSTLSGGDLRPGGRIEGQDEFGMFAAELEKMRLQIIDLFNVNNDANEHMRVAEMSALRAQINSHFLFNSLSSIKWLSRRNDFSPLLQAVDSLTVFLRYSLSLNENQAPLAEEIEQLHAYIYLQKLRYEDDVVFHIDVDDELLAYKTVKLILQPLFENAIYHGRRHDGSPLHITLYAEFEGDMYCLIVEDDGTGIEQERIDAIYSDNVTVSSSGYGLKNVMTRVKICSDEKGSVRIESQVGVFTKITVMQPISH